MNVKLPPAEWMKMLFVVLGAVLGPVAVGAWYMSGMQADVESNKTGIKAVTESVGELADQIKALIRHDERINLMEKQLAALGEQVLKTDDQVDKIQFEQANRTSSVARINTLEAEVRLLKKELSKE